MASYAVEVRRCEHIKVNGTQCGSPALKEQPLCYFHQQNRPAPAELYIDGDRYCDSTIMIPPFEDAHSIQMVLRHIVQLMLQRRIDRKDAGLALYALQIASSNLKQMQAEKPRPTQVVVEPEKVAETPIGMTPWSASGEGHDPEEEAEVEDNGAENDGQWREDVASLREATDLYRQELAACRKSAFNRAAAIRDWLRQKLSYEQLAENFEFIAKCADSESEVLDEFLGDGPPPHEIRACAEEPRYVV